MISGEPSRTPLRRLTPSHYVEFSRLGEGSMGLVYLALDTELNRRVAFKMIRPLEEEEGAEPLEATPSPEDESFGELKARFLQEAWVTGGLEHPGIVPVYELGETTGGIPYYTMRVVRGEKTLTDAIEQAQGLDGRLALLEPFLKVCDTVRYAHARGVIHRDLKPANIALGDYGEAVVLDWGLAKLKDRPDLARSVWQKRIEELRDETDLHTLASAIGTPGYMSPEAALVEIDKVDARSDVYSLGAILYRILTGKLPYEFQSYPELVQKLTGEVPRDPSEVDAAVPAGLSRICLKALSAKREERYSDADEVAAAIRAWQRESALEREVASLLREAESALETAPNLAGEALLRQVDRVTSVCARILDLRPGDAKAEALQARGHELRERAIGEREQGARRRLLKRVAIVGLATATAATVIVALLLDAKRREAEEARTREAQARTQAEQERMRAEDLAGFMLIDLRDGLRPIGRLDLLGKVALKSKDYYESLPSEDVSTEVLRGRSVAFCNVGDVLAARGDLNLALDSFRESLAIRRRLAERHPADAERQRDLTVAIDRIGRALRAQGDLEGALRSTRESIAICRRLTDRDPSNADWQRDLSTALNDLGHLQEARGNLDRALESYRSALAIREKLIKRDAANAEWQQDLCVCLDNIGRVHMSKGDLPRAVESYRAGLAIAQRLAEQDARDADRQHSLAGAHNNVGNALKSRGDLEGALQNFRRAVVTLDQLVERDPSNAEWQSDLGFCTANVGRMLEARRDLEGALGSYRDALAIRRKLVAQDPANAEWRRNLTFSINEVGQILEARGDLDGALESYRESLGIRSQLAEQDPTNSDWQRDLGDSLDRVGSVLSRRGDAEGALRNFRRSLAIAERLVASDPTNGPWQREVCVRFARIGDVLSDTGHHRDALRDYRESVAVGLRLVDRDPSNAGWQRDLAVSQLNVGLALETLGELSEAARSLRAAMETHRRAVKLAAHFEREHAHWEAQYRRLALLKGDAQPESAADHLTLGYAFYDRKAFVKSAERFAAALEDERLRADLNRSNLYNAACAATLASASLAGEEASRWRKRALEWLDEDLRRRRDVLVRVEKELAGNVPPERAARLRRVRAAVRSHFEHARVKDSDLASLRGTPEFEALFEETDDER